MSGNTVCSRIPALTPTYYGATQVVILGLLLLLKSVEFDDDVALLLSVAGLVMGPHVTSESEIGSKDSAALRTSRD